MTTISDTFATVILYYWKSENSPIPEGLSCQSPVVSSGVSQNLGKINGNGPHEGNRVEDEDTKDVEQQMWDLSEKIILILL